MEPKFKHKIEIRNEMKWNYLEMVGIKQLSNKRDAIKKSSDFNFHKI